MMMMMMILVQELNVECIAIRILFIVVTNVTEYENFI